MKKGIKKYQKNEVEQVDDAPVFMPVVDIYEKDDSILVRCDMPNTEEENINVTLENNELTVVGKQTEAKQEGLNLLSGEYNTGIFKRTFKIPHSINQSKIKANLNNGVLDIELPKSEEDTPKKITVTTSD